MRKLETFRRWGVVCVGWEQSGLGGRQDNDLVRPAPPQNVAWLVGILVQKGSIPTIAGGSTQSTDWDRAWVRVHYGFQLDALGE